MIKLYVDDAVKLVRKNMDEVDSGTEAMLAEASAAAIDEVIMRTIPEAVNAVNLQAPVGMLEGEQVDGSQMENVTKDGNIYVTNINIRPYSSLRFLRAKAQDSAYIVTSTVQEDSPEGRMQLNPYTCGRSDHPVVVEHPAGTYTYYSHEAASDGMTFVYHMPVCQLEAGSLYGTAGGKHYLVSPRVLDAIVYHLTALVMGVYGLTDKAQYYMALVKQQIEG